MWQQLLTGIQQQDQRSLARSISCVENEVPGLKTSCRNYLPDMQLLPVLPARLVQGKVH